MEDFHSKYTNQNWVSRRLISNFYENIGELLNSSQELENIISVLEVGCGPGFSTSYLAEKLRGKHFEASDVSEELAEMAQKRNPNIIVGTESIYNLKRSDNGFDLILALEVLEHLENPEAALKELHRVSNKYVILSVPNEPLWNVLNVARGKYLGNFGNTPGHVNHWSKKSFSNFVSKYFKIRKIVRSLPWIIILGQK